MTYIYTINTSVYIINASLHFDWLLSFFFIFFIICKLSEQPISANFHILCQMSFDLALLSFFWPFLNMLYHLQNSTLVIFLTLFKHFMSFTDIQFFGLPFFRPILNIVCHLQISTLAIFLPF